MVGTARSIEITKVSYHAWQLKSGVPMLPLVRCATISRQLGQGRQRSGGSPLFMINHRSSFTQSYGMLTLQWHAEDNSMWLLFCLVFMSTGSNLPTCHTSGLLVKTSGFTVGFTSYLLWCLVIKGRSSSHDCKMYFLSMRSMAFEYRRVFNSLLN